MDLIKALTELADAMEAAGIEELTVERVEKQRARVTLGSDLKHLDKARRARDEERQKEAKTPNDVTRKALLEAEHPEDLKSYDSSEDLLKAMDE